MKVQQIYSAKNALEGLMLQTIFLTRHCNEVRSMKNFIHCYDILELTHEINKPWDDHPGFVYGDLGAFVDLEITCQEIGLRKDPNPVLTSEYLLAITKFLIYWKRASENRAQAKITPLLKR
jgi:hypothetical protein